MHPPQTIHRQAIVEALRRKLESSAGPSADESQIVSTGILTLDRLLPAQGLRPGSLIEFLTSSQAGGAGLLALTAVRTACEEGRLCVISDRQQHFYPPAAAAWGIDLQRTVLLRPATAADELWALNQALRCPGVGAVWARCGRLHVREFRRLQLAAEAGGTLGLLLRPTKLLGQPTWADVQWLIEPQPARQRWRLRVTLVRCRGGTGGRSVELEWNAATAAWCDTSDSHATPPLPSSAELADPTSARRQTRA